MARKPDYLYKLSVALEEAGKALSNARHSSLLVNITVLESGNAELLTLLAEHMPSAVERAYLKRRVDQIKKESK